MKGVWMLNGLALMLSLSLPVRAQVPAVCPGPASGVPGQHVVQFQHANLARQMIVYIPASYQPATAVPVVIALHGGSGNATIPYNNWGLTLLADQEGIIVAFPNGLPQPGGAANNLFWGDPINISFIGYVLDLMQCYYTIDAPRMYLVGFSGGAKLSYEVAADALVSARLAAIATASGEIGSQADPSALMELIDPAVTGGVPLSALLVHGANDEKMPIEGGYSAEKGEFVPSVPDKMLLLANWIDASEDYPQALAYAPVAVRQRRFVNVSTGMEIAGLTDPNLAHAWPAWDLAGEMWEFFQRVPTR
jgi:polyhydroxybutyrate depolymerase